MFSAETAAFFQFLQPNEDNQIDCKRFAYEFLQLGKLEHQRQNRRQEAFTAKRNQLEADRIADINERYSNHQLMQWVSVFDSTCRLFSAS
jgi:hypothetical protein